MTGRKYRKLVKKLDGAIKILTVEDPETTKTLQGIRDKLSETYKDQFTGEDEPREPKVKTPQTHELAFVSMGEEIKYGYREIATGAGGFEFMQICPKTKKLIKVIQENGADEIQLQMRSSNLEGEGALNRDNSRIHKVAEKCGYQIKMRGADYIMVKEKTEN